MITERRTFAGSKRFPFALRVLVAVAGLWIACMCSCADSRAARELDEALRLGESGETASAVEHLRRIEDEYPGTEAAERARQMLPVYEGLLTARRRFPVRQALDLMRQISAAIDEHRQSKGVLPSTLEELVPEELGEIPHDPWGAAFSYSRAGGHYTLSTLGADGRTGGTDEMQDLEIRDGELTAAPSWAER